LYLEGAVAALLHLDWVFVAKRGKKRQGVVEIDAIDALELEPTKNM